MPTKPTTSQPTVLALLEQRRALDAQIKAARATDRHVPVYVTRTLLPRVKRRIAGGTDRDAALDAELADVRAALVKALEAPTDAD